MRQVRAGARIPERLVLVDAEPMKVFSLLTADPNPIHWDAEAVRRVGLGDRVVNQGGLNMGYVSHAVTAWAGSNSRLRNIRVRFLTNVFAGETVIAGGEVTEVTEHPSGTRAELTVWLRRPDGTQLVSGTAVAEFPIEP